MKLIKLLIFLMIPSLVIAQNQVFEKVQKTKSTTTSTQFNLVKIAPSKFMTPAIKAEVSNGLLLDLNFKAISQLRADKPEFVQLNLPLPNQTEITVDLVKNKVLSEDFILRQSSNISRYIKYDAGEYYHGVISGDPNTLVAISIFNDEINGMIMTDDGNFVLGKIAGTNQHIIYDDTDLINPIGLDCETEDDGEGYHPSELEFEGQRTVGDCIRVYIEIDDDIVTQKGGTAHATNYITGMFNESITLFANDGLTLIISEILAWDTPAPYLGSTSTGTLFSYISNTDTFNGDLSHLVSYQNNGGVAAGVGGICNSNPDLSKCFSSVDASYNIVPQYSWSVFVITHEMGHLLGSSHTHDCVWNGNNTAIDGCAGATGGSCSLPANPPDGGTIMSYCHWTTGINFNLGFGPQPQAVLLNTVNNTTCTSPCAPCYGNEITISINPTNMNGGNNGAIDLTVNGGVPPYTYDWSNGGNTQNLSGLAAGDYTVTVTDPNNCTKSTTATIIDETCYGHELALNILMGDPTFTLQWFVQDINGETVLQGYGQFEDSMCLPSGCYTFSMLDVNGIFCCDQGTDCCDSDIGDYFLVNNSNGDTIFTSNGQFQSFESTFFCISPINLNFTVTNMNGGNNGAIDLTVNGGLPPYTYMWSNGASTQNLSDLAAGDYTVTVTDANNYIKSGTTTIFDDTCYDHELALNILMGDPTSTLQWFVQDMNGGTVLQGYGQFEDNMCLPVGCYTFSMIDINGTFCCDQGTDCCDSDIGDYFLIDNTNNDTIFMSNGQFQSFESTFFCINDLPTISYCSSSASSQLFEWIETVQIGSINQTSGENGGYADFTSLSPVNSTGDTINTIASIGDTVSLSLTPGFRYDPYDEHWKVWVDYNRDGDFLDPNEEVFSAFGQSTVSGSFIIPDSVVVSDLRIRVSMQYNTPSASCEAFSYGEVEDYTLIIASSSSNPFQNDVPAALQVNSDLNDRIEKRDEESQVELVQKTSLKVYPNPVKDILQIDITLPDNTQGNLIITDINGSIIQPSQIISTTESRRLNVQNLASGIYFVHFLSDHSKITEKFIVIR